MPPATNTTISIQRATRTSDGAGGKTEVFGNVYSGLAASRRFYLQHRSTLLRTEGASGVHTEYDTLFVLRATPFPTVQINDLIVDSNGVKYVVLYIRPEAHTLQIDTRRMQ